MSIPGRRMRAGSLQQVDDLLVGRLVEVLVKAAHGEERGRGRHADDVVGPALQIVEPVGGSHGHGDDDARGTSPARRFDRGHHRRARRQPVVDEDDRPPLELERRLVVAVGAFPAPQLALLALDDAAHGFGGHAEAAEESLVEDADSPEATAPMAYSSLPGKPSLRTRNTSSGAPMARATS